MGFPPASWSYRVWPWFHGLARRFDADATERAVVLRWLTHLASLLPCEICRQHFAEMLATDFADGKTPALESGLAFNWFGYTVDARQRIAKRMGRVVRPSEFCLASAQWTSGADWFNHAWNAMQIITFAAPLSPDATWQTETDAFFRLTAQVFPNADPTVWTRILDGQSAALTALPANPPLVANTVPWCATRERFMLTVHRLRSEAQTVPTLQVAPLVTIVQQWVTELNAVVNQFRAQQIPSPPPNSPPLSSGSAGTIGSPALQHTPTPTSASTPSQGTPMPTSASQAGASIGTVAPMSTPALLPSQAGASIGTTSVSMAQTTKGGSGHAAAAAAMAQGIRTVGDRMRAAVLANAPHRRRTVAERMRAAVQGDVPGLSVGERMRAAARTRLAAAPVPAVELPRVRRELRRTLIKQHRAAQTPVTMTSVAAPRRPPALPFVCRLREHCRSSSSSSSSGCRRSRTSSDLARVKRNRAWSTAFFWCLVAIGILVMLLVLYALWIGPRLALTSGLLGLAATTSPPTIVAAPAIATVPADDASLAVVVARDAPVAAAAAVALPPPAPGLLLEEMRPYMVSPMVTTIVEADSADDEIPTGDTLPDDPDAAEFTPRPAPAPLYVEQERLF